jgi:hypothetical protein
MICGLRPAVLKALLRRDSFDTPTAMKHLSLNEPDATSTMMTLAADGWIAFRETNDFVDWWRTDDRGMRLVATRLLKRIPLIHKSYSGSGRRRDLEGDPSGKCTHTGRLKLPCQAK